jgi:hypothetical protein
VADPEVESQWQAMRELMGGVNFRTFEKLGNHVCSGPFKGMLISQFPNWDDGNAGGKLLGCYEHELWPAIEVAIGRRPSAVINVGSAEGYYAIGFKLRLPAVPVIACDINAVSLEQCAQLAEQNGVEIQTRIGCRFAEELSFGYEGALYVVDCEGDELRILKPYLCAELRSADIIVECHDYGAPFSQVLTERFDSSHWVYLINPQLPKFREYQAMLDPWPIGLKLQVIAEKRPMPTAWLAMFAKDRKPR